ncbi:unnamed protein product [Ectocarpus sp. 12 AP-2014]
MPPKGSYGGEIFLRSRARLFLFYYLLIQRDKRFMWKRKEKKTTTKNLLGRVHRGRHPLSFKILCCVEARFFFFFSDCYPGINHENSRGWIHAYVHGIREKASIAKHGKLAAATVCCLCLMSLRSQLLLLDSPDAPAHVSKQTGSI